MKVKTYKMGSLLGIRWADAWSVDVGWTGAAVVNACAKSAINQTVGYLVRQDRRQMVLAQSTHNFGERFTTLTGIPIGCILKIRRYKNE